MILRMIAQCLGILIGTSLSPSWGWMKTALQGYFDIDHAFSGPQAFAMSILRFQALIDADPVAAMSDLLPRLILILMFGSVFVMVITELVTKTITILARHTGLMRQA